MDSLPAAFKPVAGSEADFKELGLVEKGTMDEDLETSTVLKTESPNPRTNTNDIPRPPLVRYVAFAHRFQALATERLSGACSRVVDTATRLLRLIFLTLAVIFIVMMASCVMAVSHWFIVVFGHIILRYIVPASLDDTFATSNLDYTAVFAAIGAFVVNLPPFIVFLLSLPLTFDRTVLEGSTAPVNEFTKRITPNNRVALLFIKYVPRLAAGPLGWAIVRLLAPDESFEHVLPPAYAAVAGLAGEVVLSCMGLLKDVLRRRFATRNVAQASEGDLPM